MVYRGRVMKMPRYLADFNSLWLHWPLRKVPYTKTRSSIFRDPIRPPAAQGSILVPNTVRNARIHSGCPGQAAANVVHERFFAAEQVRGTRDVEKKSVASVKSYPGAVTCRPSRQKGQEALVGGRVRRRHP